jgi:hypothetical protein
MYVLLKTMGLSNRNSDVIVGIVSVDGLEESDEEIYFY